jgi:hypothetical protein
MIFIYISLLINICVAGFWGVVLSRNIRFMRADEAFGTDSPARRILGCLYLTIALASIVPLFKPSLLISICSVLFSLQIFYKLCSFVSLPHIKNPVIASNLLIAALHGVSLYILLTKM